MKHIKIFENFNNNELISRITSPHKKEYINVDKNLFKVIRSIIPKGSNFIVIKGISLNSKIVNAKIMVKENETKKTLASLYALEDEYFLLAGFETISYNSKKLNYYLIDGVEGLKKSLIDLLYTMI